MKFVRFVRQRANRAKISNVALHFGRKRSFEIGGDLGVFPASNKTHIGHATHFRGEPHAPRAVDAAGHDRLDERTDFLVFNGALVLVEP